MVIKRARCILSVAMALLPACRSAPAPQGAQAPSELDVDLEGIVKQARVLVVLDDKDTYWAFRTEGVLEAVESTLTLAEGTTVAMSSGDDDPDAIADRLMSSLGGGSGGGSFSFTTNAGGRLIDTASTQQTKGHVVITVRRVLRPRPCTSDDGCKGHRVCRRGACVEAPPDRTAAPS